jgi:hypothetical protein
MYLSYLNDTHIFFMLRLLAKNMRLMKHEIHRPQSIGLSGGARFCVCAQPLCKLCGGGSACVCTFWASALTESVCGVDVWLPPRAESRESVCGALCYIE